MLVSVCGKLLKNVAILSTPDIHSVDLAEQIHVSSLQIWWLTLCSTLLRCHWIRDLHLPMISFYSWQAGFLCWWSPVGTGRKLAKSACVWKYMVIPHTKPCFSHHWQKSLNVWVSKGVRIVTTFWEQPTWHGLCEGAVSRSPYQWHCWSIQNSQQQCHVLSS